MNALEKVEEALRVAKNKGIKISPGPAAFDWAHSDGIVPITCSGIGALILYYNLRRDSNSLACDNWTTILAEKLGINGWWMRRFYCGFELGFSVYVRTKNKTDMYLFDTKGTRHYYTEDDVSKVLIKLRKKWTKLPVRTGTAEIGCAELL